MFDIKSRSLTLLLLINNTFNNKLTPYKNVLATYPDV